MINLANFHLVIFIILMVPIAAEFRLFLRTGFNVLTIDVLVRLIMISLPMIVLVPRIYRRYRHGEALISEGFARARTFGLSVGKFFISIGTIGVLLSLTVILWVAVTRQAGIPAGLGIGLSMYPLMIGLLFIEFSQLKWAWKSK